MAESNPVKNYWNSFSKYYREVLEDPQFVSGLCLTKMLKLESAKSILEVGCGTGGLTLHWIPLLPSGSKYTSVDISEEMVKSAQHKKDNLKVQLSGVDHSFVVGDAEKLTSIPDESVDVYIAPLNYHVLANPKDAIKEAFRVVKKGGKIGLSVLGPRRKSSFFTLQDDAISDVTEPIKNRSIHVLGEEGVLIKLAEEAGFKVDYCWEFDVPVSFYDSDDLEKLQNNPNLIDFFASRGDDVKNKVKERLQIRLEEAKKTGKPLIMNDVLLVATKP